MEDIESKLLPTHHKYRWARMTNPDGPRKQLQLGYKKTLYFLFGTPVRCFVTIASAVFLLTLTVATSTDSVTLIDSYPSTWLAQKMGSEQTKDGLEQFLGPKKKRDEGFTIVTPTYRRNDMLQQFLQKYGSGEIPSLDKIIIAWQDQENKPPQSLLDLLPTLKVPTIIRNSPYNRLSERFRPDPRITSEGVLSIDDDVLFNPKDIEVGYQAWKEFGGGRLRMLGFGSRDVTDDMKYDPMNTDKYSMVLTKAAFLHNDWLQGYWSEENKELREYADKNMNCEDILLSFLYAKKTRKSPIFFHAPFEDKGFSGISSKPHHYEMRTDCVRLFTTHFGNDTLIRSTVEMARKQ